MRGRSRHGGIAGGKCSVASSFLVRAISIYSVARELRESVIQPAVTLPTDERRYSVIMTLVIENLPTVIVTEASGCRLE